MSDPTLFDNLPCEITLEEVFEAYYSCRKNKRGTINAIAFEMDYEHNLIRLWQEINNGTYKPGRSIAFIVRKPVQREIFAADFRDRVVHHLIIKKTLPLFEHCFNPHAYSCRVGKGTLFGIKDVYQMIKDASDNYTSECYVMKLDIKGFFMHINQRILFKRLQEMVDKYYIGGDKSILLNLIEKTVFNKPQENCIIKGKRSDWKGLPRDKSLFYADLENGIPIGNLTSQVFANFYLNRFDKFVCGLDKDIKYGRYVDDFVIVHKDKAKLLVWRDEIRKFLKRDVHLTLHPNKFHLQSYRHGLAFIGVFMLPYRVYAGRRLKGNMFAKIKYYADLVATKYYDRENIAKAIAVCNSYLGFLRHHATFNIRKRAWECMEKALAKFATCAPPYESFTMMPWSGESAQILGELSKAVNVPHPWIRDYPETYGPPMPRVKFKGHGSKVQKSDQRCFAKELSNKLLTVN